MKTFRQLLGERLTELRRAALLTEAQLASKTKTSRAGIYEIEAGEKKFTIDQYEKLVRGCDVSPETALAGFNKSDIPEKAHDVFWTLLTIAKAPNNDDVLQGLRMILAPLADKALQAAPRKSSDTSQAKANSAPKEKKKRTADVRG